MKVFVLAPKENWICDRITTEWYRENDNISTNNPQEADVIWLQAGWCWNHLTKNLLENKKIICTEHHIVPEKFNQKSLHEFLYRDKFVDLYHVPNEKTYNIVKQLTKKPIVVLNYWVDLEKWKPGNRESAKKNLQLPKNKFIVSSFQRDSEGLTDNPKLEKGPDLFLNLVQKIRNQKDVHVLLGGYRRNYLVKNFKKEKINYTLIELADIKKLREMYLATDLYIVASRHEGGPQALLEAPASMTPLITSDVGIAKNVICKKCIIDVEKDLYFPSASDVQENYKNILQYDIKIHKNNYIDLFKRVLK
jgi:glycosyltransferase involved in cell wall biosynthesis